MDNGFPKYHVVDEWAAAHDHLHVQLVEVAFNRRQQLHGGEYGVRVALADSSDEKSAAIVLCMKAAMELADCIGNALKHHEAMEESK